MFLWVDNGSFLYKVVLQDIVVVEVDSYMAAPSAGAILADLGATVIKVEPLSGDPMRGLSRPLKHEDLSEAVRGYDFGFDVDNRGKQSIAVALDQPEGADLVRSLVAKADIFMCNLLIKRHLLFITQSRIVAIKFEIIKFSIIFPLFTSLKTSSIDQSLAHGE